MLEFGAHADLALVEKGWNVKSAGSKYAANDEALSLRAVSARKWLRDLGKSHERAVIVVVTHGDFIQCLTEEYGKWHYSRRLSGWVPGWVPAHTLTCVVVLMGSMYGLLTTDLQGPCGRIPSSVLTNLSSPMEMMTSLTLVRSSR